MEPTKNFIAFSSYIAFFPSILSGPIDRPNSLVPQLLEKRIFNINKAISGCKQFLWGFFKKTVIADNLLTFTDQIFDLPENFSGFTLVIGACFYTLMLYADFSGYSDMAIGIARLLGFELSANFNFPLFSQNIADFWRRWHISLTSWLTDYVFMPLTIKWRNWGNKGMILSIIITFICISLWHGIKFNFLLFGLYHGILYVPLILTGSVFKKNKIETYVNGIPKFRTLVKMLVTFLLVTIGLVLFRSADLSNALTFYKHALTDLTEKKTIVEFYNLLYWELGFVMPILIILMILIEWNGKKDNYAIEKTFSKRKNWVRWVFYSALILLTIFFMNAGNQSFIYFKF